MRDEPPCIAPEGHDWRSPATLGLERVTASTRREGTVFDTDFCRHDCGYQRVTQTKEGGARRVYYLEADFFH